LKAVAALLLSFALLTGCSSNTQPAWSDDDITFTADDGLGPLHC
jgi:hypothetical protein